MKGRVLDIAALIDVAAGRTLYMRAVITQSTARLIPLAIPTTALTVAWSQATPKGRLVLATLCELGISVIEPLGQHSAGPVGELLERTTRVGHVDVTAGHTAAIAEARGWPIVTDRGPQLRALIPHLEIEPLT